MIHPFITPETVLWKSVTPSDIWSQHLMLIRCKPNRRSVLKSHCIHMNVIKTMINTFLY